MTPEALFLAASLALVVAAGGRLALTRRAIRQAHRVVRSRRADRRGTRAPVAGPGPVATVPTRIVVASRRAAAPLQAHPVDRRSRLRRDPASVMLLAAAAVLALAAFLPQPAPTGAVLSEVRGPGGASTIPTENTTAGETTTPGAAPGPSAASEAPTPAPSPS